MTLLALPIIHEDWMDFKGRVLIDNDYYREQIEKLGLDNETLLQDLAIR